MLTSSIPLEITVFKNVLYLKFKPQLAQKDVMYKIKNNKVEHFKIIKTLYTQLCCKLYVGYITSFSFNQHPTKYLEHI